MPELILMVGLPRSGKSTICDKMFENHQIVCLDDIRISLGSVFNPLMEPYVFAISKTMCRSFMNRKRNIVIDATNVAIHIFTEYLHLSSEYDYNMKICYVKTSLEECLIRNSNTSKIPEDILIRMSKQLIDLLSITNNFSGHEVIEIF